MQGCKLVSKLIVFTILNLCVSIVARSAINPVDEQGVTSSGSISVVVFLYDVELVLVYLYINIIKFLDIKSY